MIKIGNAPCSWGVEFADDPRNPSWRKVLQENAEAGYTGIELGPVGFMPEDPVELGEALEEFGQVTYAANVSGMARRSLYDRRRRDPDFASRWDDAVEAFEETLTTRVIQTALHMGTGRWVPALDDETGEPELDDDFEPLFRFDCSNVDPRIAVKLMALRMRDLNARTAPLVAVQNNVVAPTTEVERGAPIDLDALRAEVEGSDGD